MTTDGAYKALWWAGGVVGCVMLGAHFGDWKVGVGVYLIALWVAA